MICVVFHLTQQNNEHDLETAADFHSETCTLPVFLSLWQLTPEFNDDSDVKVPPSNGSLRRIEVLSIVCLIPSIMISRMWMFLVSHEIFWFCIDWVYHHILYRTYSNPENKSAKAV